ncbi:MAG: hypothetical protein ACTHMI_04395 [Mucilaginibacter sp.]
MEIKTDKQLVWEALKSTEWYTLNPINPFYPICDFLWSNLPSNDKLRIRGILLKDGLIQLFDNGRNQWMFQLTPLGMTITENDLKADGTLKKKRSYKQFWLGVIATLIGAVLSTILSAVLEVWKANNLQQSQSKTIVLPKIQIVRDTIFLHEKNGSKKP